MRSYAAKAAPRTICRQAGRYASWRVGGRDDPSAAIYEIFESNKAASAARFRNHAARIMRQHSFDIVAMREDATGERTEFVYPLRWLDEQSKIKARPASMANEEWDRIKRATRRQGDLVGQIEERLLTLTDYSPPLA